MEGAAWTARSCYKAAGGEGETVEAQERPKIVNIGPKSRPSAAKTAYRGPKGGPEPPVETQERPKIANIGPKAAPRPPT